MLTTSKAELNLPEAFKKCIFNNIFVAVNSEFCCVYQMVELSYFRMLFSKLFYFCLFFSIRSIFFITIVFFI